MSTIYPFLFYILFKYVCIDAYTYLISHFEVQLDLNKQETHRSTFNIILQNFRLIFKIKRIIFKNNIFLYKQVVHQIVANKTKFYNNFHVVT